MKKSFRVATNSRQLVFSNSYLGSLFKQNITKQLAIIGGGISGLMCSLKAAQAGFEIVLFESEPDAMLKTSSFPIHLHSGAMYPSLPDAEIGQLLEESILFCREIPEAVVKRPTLISLHVSDPHDPSYIINPVIRNQQRYAELVAKDPGNKVFGEPEDYYRIFTRADLERLAQKPMPVVTHHPDDPILELSLEDWTIPFAKSTDLDQLQYPIVILKEWLMDMTAAKNAMMRKLEGLLNVAMFFNTRVTNVKPENSNIKVTFRTPQGISDAVFSHVLNAAGETAGIIDDMMGTDTVRFREAKQAFRIAFKEAEHEYWPEAVVMAPRGNKQAMTEVIPVSPGVFQLLSTTVDATLTEDGLAFADGKQTSHPVLKQQIERAFNGLDPADDIRRLQAVIARIADRHPRFKTATPMYVARGIVQIPGTDPNHRSGCVRIHSSNYSSALTVKATSAPYVAQIFVSELLKITSAHHKKYIPQRLAAKL